MCIPKAPKFEKPRVPIAAADNAEAMAQASMESRLRRRRAGAAADVLTSASGIPATGTMGGIAK